MAEYEEILGWKVPVNTVPCWMLEEDRKEKHLKGTDMLNHSPFCYFKITGRLDTMFIEGNLGHSSYKGEFHNDINSSYSYLRNYQERQPVYLSFDKVTIYRLVEIITERPLKFILKRLDNFIVVKPNQAFMIMPFHRETLDVFFEKHVRGFLKDKMQISVYRADDFNGNDVIVETIHKMIEESEFIIADITYCNKSVFYELGYASAKNKEIITIHSSNDPIFFNRAHIRTMYYNVKEAGLFEKNLESAIIAIRDKMQANS